MNIDAKSLAILGSHFRDGLAAMLAVPGSDLSTQRYPDRNACFGETDFIRLEY